MVGPVNLIDSRSCSKQRKIFVLFNWSHPNYVFLWQKGKVSRRWIIQTVKNVILCRKMSNLPCFLKLVSLLNLSGRIAQSQHNIKAPFQLSKTSHFLISFVQFQSHQWTAIFVELQPVARFDADHRFVRLANDFSSGIKIWKLTWSVKRVTINAYLETRSGWEFQRRVTFGEIYVQLVDFKNVSTWAWIIQDEKIAVYHCQVSKMLLQLQLQLQR